jgi:HEAT repeat protein
MSNSRFPILLTICLGCLGFIPSLDSVSLLSGLPPVFAQTTEPSPTEVKPAIPKVRETQVSRYESLMEAGYLALGKKDFPEAVKSFTEALEERQVKKIQLSRYESLMEAGYLALAKKDFPGAVESFTEALKERPDDPKVEDALEDARAQALFNPLTSEQRTFGAKLFPLLPILGAALLGLVILGALAPFLAKKYLPDLKVSKPPTPKYKFDGLEDGYGSFGTTEVEEEWNPDLPVQRTTRLPNVDLILKLIEDLKDTEPRTRRRAIWKLAQISDSRSMKSLVDSMIETDSYERSLVLEALSQICIRTLRPMNQALAISLQDQNAQVRKNALRDLTRMYNVMAQVSQLVAHATDDPDIEVQETAKWAMKQLNLPAPVKLDIPDVVADDSVASEESSYSVASEESSYTESAEFEEL